MSKVRCRDCGNLSKAGSCPKRGINTKLKTNKSRLCDDWFLSPEKIARAQGEKEAGRIVIPDTVKQIQEEERISVRHALNEGMIKTPPTPREEKKVGPTQPAKKGFLRKLFGR